MVPGLRWLGSLMHTSGSRSSFRAGLPWAPTTQIGLFCVVLGSSSGRTSRRRTPRASGPEAFDSRLPRAESTPTRCSTSRQKFQPCLAVFSRQSRCTDGLEALRLEIFVWGAPQRRARLIQRTLPTKHARGLPRRLHHGHVNLGQHFRCSPPLQRTGFVWRTSTQMLDLHLDALQRPVWPQCTHLACFSALFEPLAPLSNVLHCPSQRHDSGCTDGIKRTIQRLSEQSSASIIIVMTRSRARNAPRRVRLTKHSSNAPATAATTQQQKQ